MLTDELETILMRRGLDTEMAVQKFGARAYGSGSEILAIPYYLNGEVVNHKYRGFGDNKKFWQDSPDDGAVHCLYNIDCLKDQSLADDPVYFFEGELDVWAAADAGFMRAVSLPDGTPSSDKEVEDTIRDPSKSHRYKPLLEAMQRGYLSPADRFVLAVDDDEPGHRHRKVLLEILGEHRCMMVRYPKGCKDTGDALEKYGHKAVQLTLGRPFWAPIPGLARMSELPDEPEEEPRAIGIPGLNEHWKLRLGDTHVVTGYPGIGKSTLMNDIMGNVAFRLGWHVTVASFEQKPKIDHRRNLRHWYIGKPQHLWHECDLDMADRWIDEHFHFIVPSDEEQCDLAWMMRRTKAAAYRYGREGSLIVIDPWNEIEHARPKDLTLTEYIGDAIRMLKRQATLNRFCLQIAAHPAKPKGKETTLTLPDGTDVIDLDPPGLYDIADSAHFVNKPEIGAVVHRTAIQRLDNEASVFIRKCRYEGVIGKVGEVKLKYDPFTNRFSGI